MSLLERYPMRDVLYMRGSTVHTVHTYMYIHCTCHVAATNVYQLSIAFLSIIFSHTPYPYSVGCHSHSCITGVSGGPSCGPHGRWYGVHHHHHGGRRPGLEHGYDLHHHTRLGRGGRLGQHRAQGAVSSPFVYTIGRVLNARV